MNQQQILNKLSLNRNSDKTKLYIDQLMKILWTEAHRNLTFISPSSNGSVFTISMFTMTLQNITTLDGEDELYRLGKQL